MRRRAISTDRPGRGLGLTTLGLGIGLELALAASQRLAAAADPLIGLRSE